jgi:hypothetical protein
LYIEFIRPIVNKFPLSRNSYKVTSEFSNFSILVLSTVSVQIKEAMGITQLLSEPTESKLSANTFCAAFFMSSSPHVIAFHANWLVCNRVYLLMTKGLDLFAEKCTK